MTSFKFGGLSAKDRASGRFLMQFYREIASAFARHVKSQGVTQRGLADAIDVDKSHVSRILSGHGNPTIRTVGELAWAMKLRPRITFEPIEALSQNASGQLVITTGKPSRPSPTSVSQPVTNKFDVRWQKQAGLMDA